MAPARPEIEVADHAEAGVELTAWLAALAPAAVASALAAPSGEGEAVLPGLDLVEVSLVSDEAIARVHAEYLDDPEPTDVITFHHGEILVSVDTAAVAAPEAGTSLREEVLLYMVHGLLHLMGHRDAADPERSRMHRLQEELCARLLADPA